MYIGMFTIRNTGKKKAGNGILEIPDFAASPVRIRLFRVTCFMIMPFLFFCPVGADSLEFDHDPGGHVKARGGVMWPAGDTHYELVGDREYYDGYAGLRLTNKTFAGNFAVFEIHYEAVVSGGDTRKKIHELSERYGAIAGGFYRQNIPEDDRRFMDLAKTLSDKDDHIVYHRLDRLSATLMPAWGTVCVGRQALTWGNGLVFNPMDLFNPFAPTDIERDYKVGDDMASVRFSSDKIGEFQFLGVPRRDPVSRDVEWDRSSVAGKLHVTSGTTEFDVMAAKHYKDHVMGLGALGYAGSAAWRADATYTFPDSESGADGFFSFMANLDYSWVWMKRNFYGLAEFYYNGLGKDEYFEACSDPDIAARFDRGELYTLGKTYLALEITVELHPLARIYLTAINNLADPSGMLQPRGVWDVAENLQLTSGANVSYGEVGTEYGGFEIPGTNQVLKPANNSFVWFTLFF